MIVHYYSSNFDCAMHHNFVHITAPLGIEIMICIKHTYLNYIMLIICSASWTVSSIYGWDYDKRGRRQFSKAKPRCCIIYLRLVPKQCRTPSHTHRNKHMCTEYEANLHAYPWHYWRNCQADFPTSTSTGISGLGCALKVPTSCCDSQMGCGTHSLQADRRRSTFCRKRKTCNEFHRKLIEAKKEN